MNLKDPMNGHPLIVLLSAAAAFVGAHIPIAGVNVAFTIYFVFCFCMHAGLLWVRICERFVEWLYGDD